MAQQGNQPIQLAFSGEIKTANPFGSIVMTPVMIDTDPKKGEIFKTGQQGYGDNAIYVYGLQKPALTRLMQAGGIEVLTSDRTDDRSHPHVCSYHKTARWLLPDGSYAYADATYEFDARGWISLPGGDKVRGGRYQLEYQKEFDKLMIRKFPNETKAWQGRDATIARLKLKMEQAELAEFEAVADALAFQTIAGSHPFVVQRADSGALLRIIRALMNLKSGYTIDELKQGFMVPRTYIDRNLMLQALNQDDKRMVLLADTIKQFQIGGAELALVQQLLAPPKITQMPAVTEDPEPIVEIEAPVVVEAPAQPAPVVVEAKASKPMAQTKAPVTTPTTAQQQSAMDDYVPGPPSDDEIAQDDAWSSVPKDTPLIYRNSRGVLEVQVGVDTWKPATSEVGKVNSKTSEKIAAMFSAPNHMKNYLLKRFNVATLPALTWEQFAALISEKKDGKPDKRWFPEKVAGTMANVAKTELGGDTVVITQAAQEVLTAYGLKPEQFSEYKEFVTYMLTLPDPKCLAFIIGDGYEWKLPENKGELENLALMLSTKAVEIGDEQWGAILASAESIPF